MKSKTLITIAVASAFGLSASAFAGPSHEVDLGCSLAAVRLEPHRQVAVGRLSRRCVAEEWGVSPSSLGADGGGSTATRHHPAHHQGHKDSRSPHGLFLYPGVEREPARAGGKPVRFRSEGGGSHER